MMFIFSRPQYLILLLAIPLFVFFYLFSLKNAQKKAIKFANFRAIERIKGVEIFSKNLTVFYINVAIVALVVFSLSGLSITRDVSASQISFVIALDNSDSMGANDVPPSRLDVAKDSAKHFIDKAPEKTKIALATFSGTTYIIQELTEDKALLKNSVDNIKLSNTGGTNIAQVIATSINLLRGEDTKAIILISDGQANVNELKDMIDYAKQNKVIIHSLGIGTEEGGEDSKGGIYKLSEDTLNTLSLNTQGKYYNVKDITDFYSSLDEIVSITKKKAVTDLSVYLVIIALVLFLLNFILINTRYRTIP